MNEAACSIDLKAYVVGELAQREKAAVDDHVRACQSCREELERLKLTHSALAMLEDEEPPRRIAFVSDRVFEPRWWQTIWHSGPAMGFASAALLAIAILVNGFARPAVTASAPAVDQAQIERRVEARVQEQVNARLNVAVVKAVNEAQAKQSAEFAKTLGAAQLQRKSDLASFQQVADYYHMQMSRLEVASNAGAGQ
jgi:anti-sigma factor RsiW